MNAGDARTPGQHGLLGFVRARLQRRLLIWFGATILLTGVSVAAVFALTSNDPHTMMGARFGRVWHDPAARLDLAKSVHRVLDIDVVLLDMQRQPILTVDKSCKDPWYEVPASDEKEQVGFVAVCGEHHRAPNPIRAPLILAVAFLVLWGASGALARRLARPIWIVANAADRIGRGDLGTRVELRNQHGEMHLLAHAVNEMAGRLERQVRDQKELLAAVSHELRTPLTRIRLVTEIARDRGAADDQAANGKSLDGKSLDDIDREVEEIDSLVSELLARSRLEFQAMAPRALDAEQTARNAIERAGLSVGEDGVKLLIERATPSASSAFDADPTLLARALANLLDNAKSHAGGVDRVRVIAGVDEVSFAVDDRGPGIVAGDEERVFAAFYRGRAPSAGHSDRGSLGLGLALVERIARAHGGKAWAKNRREGDDIVGATVGFDLPKKPPSATV